MATTPGYRNTCDLYHCLLVTPVLCPCPEEWDTLSLSNFARNSQKTQFISQFVCFDHDTWIMRKPLKDQCSTHIAVTNESESPLGQLAAYK